MDIDVSGRDVADPVIGIGVLFPSPTFHSVGQIEVLLHLRDPVQDPLSVGHDQRRPDPLELDPAHGHGLHQVVAFPFEGINSRVGVGSQHTDRYRFIPLDVEPLPEILPIANRKLEQTHLVEWSRSLLAKPRFSSRFDLLHGETEIIVRHGRLDRHFMINEFELDQQAISPPAHRTGWKGSGLGWIPELQLVLIRTILGHRKDGGSGIRRQAFLAGPFVEKTSGCAAGSDDQSRLPVLQDDISRLWGYRRFNGRGPAVCLLQPTAGCQEPGCSRQSPGLQEVTPTLSALLPAFPGRSHPCLLHGISLCPVHPTRVRAPRVSGLRRPGNFRVVRCCVFRLQAETGSLDSSSIIRGFSPAFCKE